MNLREAAPRREYLSVAPDAEELGRRAAHTIAEIVRRRPDAVISLTTGRTMAGVYKRLGELCRAGSLDLGATRLISSEEYAGVGASDPISLFGWLRRDLLDPCGVPPAIVPRLAGDAPDAMAECRRFDAVIDGLGGIDLVVQSIGPNGHFGFNEPGSARDAPSRVVDLAISTQQSNARYWHDGARVPQRGLTMGVRATLQARHVLLLASGAHKAEALARAVEGPIAEDAPCSLLRLATRLTVLADAGAMERLRR